MSKEVSNGRSRRRVSAAGVSAAAAIAAALIALAALVLDLGGAADADDAVHLRLIQEPLVHDSWIVPPDIRSKPPAAGDCLESDLLARRRWLEAHEGIPVGFTVAQVEIVNDSDKTLLVEGLKLSEVRRLPRPKGTTYTLCPNGGGGPVDDQYAMVDFDQRSPELKLFNELFQPVAAVDFSPSPHHPLRFWILATSTTEHVRWRASLAYSLDGNDRSLAIPEDGKSFEIAPE